MGMNAYLLLLPVFVNFATCRDFYVGMFKKNDFLVAQDRLYKERLAYRYTYAKYGRLFKCPITYFRVVDRLGIGRGPRVEIIRGGLGQKYLVLRLTSPYNQPISVNLYVGCSSVKVTRPPRLKVKTSEEEDEREENMSVDDKKRENDNESAKPTAAPDKNGKATKIVNTHTTANNDKQETTARTNPETSTGTNKENQVTTAAQTPA